ncbi:UNVERIFIED_CONTAM: hypothetical protein K2H54_044892 [Gekko kuhli]
MCAVIAPSHTHTLDLFMAGRLFSEHCYCQLLSISYLKSNKTGERLLVQRLFHFGYLLIRNCRQSLHCNLLDQSNISSKELNIKEGSQLLLPDPKSHGIKCIEEVLTRWDLSDWVELIKKMSFSKEFVPLAITWEIS